MATETRRPSPWAKWAMRKVGVAWRHYLSEDRERVYTSAGTIVCSAPGQDLDQPALEPADCGPTEGTNGAWHRLPSSGGSR